MKTVLFKIYPKKSQCRLIDEQLEFHRRFYNYCLDIKSKSYNRGEVNITYNDLATVIKEFRENNVIPKTINYSSFQQTIRRLFKAYDRFFKKTSGFPRYKSKERFRSIEFSKQGDGWKYFEDKGILRIQGVGDIRVGNYLKINDKIKRLILTRISKNDYQIALIHEDFARIDVEKKKFENFVGIDFGFKSFLTLSSGDLIKHPKPLKESLKQIKRCGRQISKL